MNIYKNIFAYYHTFFVKYRNFTGGKYIEERQASAVICFSQILTLGVILGILKTGFGLTIVHISKLYFIPIALLWWYLNDRYFNSNRERRRNILDTYRALSQRDKNIWAIISWGIVIIPIILLPFLLSK